MNEDATQLADVYIENGKITAVGLNLHLPGGVRVIDARDKLVLPGGIDTHTHMELAFMGTKAVDDFDIGTKVNTKYRTLICYRKAWATVWLMENTISFHFLNYTSISSTELER